MGRRQLEASWQAIGFVLVLVLPELNSHVLRGTQVQPHVVEQQQTEPGGRRRPVLVKCHPDSMEVVVQADMFNTGLRVDAGHLRLGSGGEGGACRASPSGEAQYTLQAQLMTCGTRLSSTKQKIIYSNVLVYSPEVWSAGLQRLDGAAVPVQCYYDRRYAVDGPALRPAWIPSVSRASADDHIEFNLQLMSEDWRSERGSRAYFLGDLVNFEASVVMVNHAPLRVYVDHCVATTTPDPEATLRYDFINHYGCLSDAYLTNSRSHFLPRVEDHMLRFQIEAFRFYWGGTNQVYVTCYMKASPVNTTAGSQSRACSLIQKRWRSVDGNHQVCGSCDISHRAGPPSTESPTTSSTTTAQERNVKYITFYPGLHQSRHKDNNQAHHSSADLVKGGAERGADRTVQLGPLTVLTSAQFAPGWTDSRSIRAPTNKMT